MIMGWIYKESRACGLVVVCVQLVKGVRGCGTFLAA